MTKQFETDQSTYEKDHGTVVIYRRPDHKEPKWQTRIKINGSRGYVRRSTGHTDEKKAYAKAMELYDALAQKYRDTGSTTTKTFKQVAKEWLAILRTQKDRTDELVHDFEARLNRYGHPFFGDDYIDKIDDDRLVEWKDWRSQKVSNATIVRDIVPLRQLFDWAFTKKYITQPVKFPKIEVIQDRRPAFEGSQWNDLVAKLDPWLKEAKWHPRLYRDRVYLRAFILIVGNLGVRPYTETRHLKWSHLTKEVYPGKSEPQLTMFIPRVKKKVKPRRILAEKAARYFNQLKKFRKEECQKWRREFTDDEFIFCHEDGKPIQSFKKSFRTCMEEFGLTPDEGGSFTEYSLRHTFATRMVASGKVTSVYLAGHMGTSDNMIQRHYYHRDHREGVDMLDVQSPIPRPTLNLDDWFEAE